MNGYATKIALWREATLLGSQSGAAFRPVGVIQVFVRPIPITNWQIIDPLRAVQEQAAVHQAWSVTIRREFKVGTFDNYFIDALSDGTTTTTGITGGLLETRDRIDNPALRTFGLEFILEDGNQRRITGAALTRVEWIIESGRINVEEVELIALRSDAFTGAVRSHTVFAGAAFGSITCDHAFVTGTAWTGADANNDLRTTLSGQLIWSRDVSAAQFNVNGLATRHSVNGAWDFVGRSRLLLGSLWGTLHATTRSKSRWRIGSQLDGSPASTYWEIEADVHAKLAGHATLAAGQIEHMLDFAAIRPAGSRSHYRIRKYRFT